MSTQSDQPAPRPAPPAPQSSLLLRASSLLLPLLGLVLVGSLLGDGRTEEEVTLAAVLGLGTACYLSARALRGFPRRLLHHVRQVLAGGAAGAAGAVVLTFLVEAPSVSVDGSELYPLGVVVVAGLTALALGLLSLVMWGVDSMVQRRAPLHEVTPPRS